MLSVYVEYFHSDDVHFMAEKTVFKTISILYRFEKQYFYNLIVNSLNNKPVLYQGFNIVF